MADLEVSQTYKAHHAPLSGRKAEKKKAKNKHVQELTPRQRNPKAFAMQSSRKAETKFRRQMDIEVRRHHIPTVNRTPVKPPPTVIAIIGPPKVGKTLLMHCMIKRYTSNKMTSVQGPVTVISGKKNRITFIECNNDINSMIDIAKIADLALLLIDAKVGFEMETFEFLNICQVHGMPRLIGVLSHLDVFTSQKALQNQKAALKKRFKVELPRAEKMFYLSGLLDGEYLTNEIHNLCRFISVIRFELSSWKKSHPYVFVDRMEDITDPAEISDKPTCSRKVCLYGYARGGTLKVNSYYHIPGCGDYFVKNINFLPDPCPIVDKTKRRSLNEKERRVYAPMSGVGGIVYDKDAVYIETKGNQLPDKETKEREKLFEPIMTADQPLDEKLKTREFRLLPDDDITKDEDVSSSDEEEDRDNFHNSNKQSNFNTEDKSDAYLENEDDLSEDESEDNSSEDENEGSPSEDKDKRNNMNKAKKKVRFADEDSDTNQSKRKSEHSEVGDAKRLKLAQAEDENVDEIGHIKWKENIIKKAVDDFYRRQNESISLQKLVYGMNKTKVLKEEDSDSDKEEIGGLFRLAKFEKEKKSVTSDDGFDTSRFELIVDRNWESQEELDSIRDCFVTGKWGDAEDAVNLLQKDDELYGDFEDFETGEVHKHDEDDDSSGKEGEEDDDGNVVPKEKKTRQEKRLEKKKRLKEIFNSQFDGGKSFYDELKEEVDAQGDLNKKEFADMDDEIRVLYEGFWPGLYIRIEIDQMPCEFVNNFDPDYPIIVGSLRKGEEKMGYLQVRLKNHRWYPRILKSRDPLIMSLGWRRLQTTPLYYVTQADMRNRHLKYTNKNLHCNAAFWGPITQQKAGFVAMQTVSEVTNDFRIAAIGCVTEVNQVTNITKKLKLIGAPMQIMKNSAFIKDMFHSTLEAAKYEGARIRTVSGIRGEIKKALNNPPGAFRATFEDKILMSDIVSVRTWVSVTVPKFYIPVTSLLLPQGKKDKWQGAKTLGRLRYEMGLHPPVSKDSNYTRIKRVPRVYAPLQVPSKLQKELPFKDKVVHMPTKFLNPERERVTVIREPKEREIAQVLHTLKTIQELKMKKDLRDKEEKSIAFQKQKAKDDKIRHEKQQALKKQALKKLSRRAAKK